MGLEPTTTGSESMDSESAVGRICRDDEVLNSHFSELLRRSQARIELAPRVEDTRSAHVDCSAVAACLYLQGTNEDWLRGSLSR